MPTSATSPAETVYRVPGDLAVVREFVRAESEGLGLSSGRADLLAVAVSELATNTLQHTDGGGVVRIWAEPGLVRCEVVDGGEPPGFGRAMPAADQPRGRGLAIVERICDEVGIRPAGDGTAVRLGMVL
ncbi:ATP-binding protein [Actinoplanes sp. KI2]|uniref:ATP-binding protein n=1 Tax=Actinoplanes sp. KI2 TaxID=2983315 RepID=UPI0021D6146D|nr:ATP-binding protein [Actinoplanes sp. KI2]MCU7726984.1 ATP-binding protein [Actinoplanes sp. KI2]